MQKLTVAVGFACIKRQQQMHSTVKATLTGHLECTRQHMLPQGAASKVQQAHADSLKQH